MDASISWKIAGTKMTVTAYGQWRSIHITDVDRILRDFEIPNIKQCEIVADQILAIDTTGALIMLMFSKKLEENGIKVTFSGLSKQQHETLNQVLKFTITKNNVKARSRHYYDLLVILGKSVIADTSKAILIIQFFGQVVYGFITYLIKPDKIRWPSISNTIEKTGINALPIIGMISFLVGVVLIYQGAYQLKRFGAEIFAVDLLAISVTREVGILITAIVVAGRSGSSFTAQIGTMKLNQEIDAMATFGIDSILALVLPRIIGLMIALPLLAFYSDIMGLIGGMFMAMATIDMSMQQFLSQLNQALTIEHFAVGMIKAPFFGLIIALIGCFEGMQVKGGAESIGLRTTMSVVESIFLVIVANAAFSVLFTYLGV